MAPAESARWRGHGLPEELGTASAPAIHPDYLQPVESGALRRSDPGRLAQPPAEASARPSQVSLRILIELSQMCSTPRLHPSWHSKLACSQTARRDSVMDGPCCNRKS